MRSFLVLATSSMALAIALLGAAPAGAEVANIHGHGYGITPQRSSNGARLARALQARHASSPTQVRRFDEPPFAGSQLEYLGGPVMHSTDTHVIYWDPNKEFTTKTKEVVESFFTGVAHDAPAPANVFGVAGQYTDKTGNAAYSGKFEGALLDETAYPASGCTVPKESFADKGPPYTNCLEDSQEQTELSKFIKEKSLPKGPPQLYFLLLPHKVATCLPEFVGGAHVCSNNFYCAYHSFIAPGSSNEIIYADIPFSLLDSGNAKGCQLDQFAKLQNPNGDTAGTDASTRFADVALKYASHEWIEAATDPLVGDQTAWVDELGLEIGDKCNGYPVVPELEGEPGFDKHAFTPTLGGEAGAGTLYDQLIDGGHYYLQSEWDNGARACTMKPAPITGVGIATKTPTPRAGSPVSFEASAKDPYGGLVLSWKFGDGSEATGPAPIHTYAARGEYTVTLTATDTLVGTAAEPVTMKVTVGSAHGPAAAFTISPDPGSVGEAVKFDGSTSSDPEAAITEYLWDFGDGAHGTGVTPTHAYKTAGEFTVTLTVKNELGETSSTSHAVKVVGPPPPEPVVPPVIPPAGGTTGTLTGGGQSGTLASIVSMPPTPDSTFATTASVNAKTGVLTFSASVQNPGTLSWLATFANGRFGAFSSATKCRSGQIRLAGRCRPAKITFAKGSKSVAGAGMVTVTLKPSASGLKALKNALKRKQGVPVTVTFTFQSSLGGSPSTHSRTITVKLKR
jgi:PKD repeat protein